MKIFNFVLWHIILPTDHIKEHELHHTNNDMFL
jgi:hypothetical protein